MSISDSTCVLVAVPLRSPATLVRELLRSWRTLEIAGPLLWTCAEACFWMARRLACVDDTARIEAMGSSVQWIQGIPHVDGVLAASRAFGNVHYNAERTVTAEPDILEVRMWPGHIALLLYCDSAMEGALGDAEVAAIVSAELAARAVCLEAIRARSRDNVSCMVDLQASPWS